MALSLVRILSFFSLFVFAIVCSAGAAVAKAAEETRSTAPPNRVMRGIYLHNGFARNLSSVERYVQQGKPLGLNMFVLDVQTYGGQKALITTNVMHYLRQEGMYTAMRVVCFQDGIKTLPIPQWQLNNLYTIIEDSAKCGADEVQLDYIRFEDSWNGIPIEQKNATIENILAKARTLVAPYNVKLSADVFGRIPYNRRDAVGQNIEGFAKHVDVIYPMLYPSHFTADTLRLSQPGFTVKEGTQLTLDRVQGTGVAVQPYIQVFHYNIGWAQVNLVRYIELQIEGAESTTGRGWVAWNAGGEYGELWQAMGNVSRRAAEVSVSQK